MSIGFLWYHHTYVRQSEFYRHCKGAMLTPVSVDPVKSVKTCSQPMNLANTQPPEPW